MKKTLSTILMISACTASVSQAGLKETLGQIAGGLFAGSLCNELGIGNGSGRTAAIAICALGGSMIGGDIGRDMDAADARAFEEEQRRSFEGDLNRDYTWDGRKYGSRSGITGTLRPTRHGYHGTTREVCREYRSVTHRGNRTSDLTTVVCKRRDGSFYELTQKTLFINGQVVEQVTTRNQGQQPTHNPPPPYVTPGRRPPPPPPIDDYGYGNNGTYDNNGSYDGSGRQSHRDYNRNQVCRGWDLSQVRYGDWVYLRNEDSFKFVGLSRNGQWATVQRSNSTPSFPAADLGIKGCHLGMKTGSFISTRHGHKGKLVAIFANGDVIIDVNDRYLEVFRNDEVLR